MASLSRHTKVLVWIARVVAALVLGGIVFVVIANSFDRGHLRSFRCTRWLEASRGPDGAWRFSVVGEDPMAIPEARDAGSVLLEIQESSSGRIGSAGITSWRMGSCIVTSMVKAGGEWAIVDSSTGDVSLDAALTRFVEKTLISESTVINQWPNDPLSSSSRDGLTWLRWQHRLNVGRLVLLIGVSIVLGAVPPAMHVLARRIGVDNGRWVEN